MIINRQFFKELALIGFLALCYFLAGKLGLKLAVVNLSATAVWAPTGITIAAFLLFGSHIWPAIFLGAFFTNITTAGSIPICIGIALGNTFEGLLAANLIHQYAGGQNFLDRPQTIFKFAFLAAMIATMVSPTIGVTVLSLGGFANWSSYGAIWMTWWIGDMVGALVVTPLVVLWAIKPYSRPSRKQVFEGLCLLTAIFLVGFTVFGSLLSLNSKNYPIEFICIPLLIWAVFRFGQHEAATTTFLLSGIATWGTIHGYGPFVNKSPNASLVLLQIFMGTMSLMASAMSADVEERRNGEDNLRSTQENLERRVSERTASLSGMVARLQTEMVERRMAQQALTESEKRYRNFVDSALDTIYIVSIDGKIITLNPAFENLTGWPSHEWIGKDFFPIIHPDDLPHVMKTMEKIGKGEDIKKLECRILTRSGETRYVETSMTPDRESSQVTRVLGIARDVTEGIIAQRKIFENELKLKRLIESVTDHAFYMLDTQGMITTWNVTAERIKGYRSDEIIGKYFGQFYLPDEQAAGKPEMILANARRFGRYEDEGWHVRKDGSLFWAHAVISAVYDDEKNLTGFSKVTQDLTERKRAEEERMRLVSEQLARRQAEVAQERALFLAEASALIFATLDYDSIPLTVVRLAALRIADWSAVYLIDDNGSINHVEVAHSDPSKDDVIQRLKMCVPSKSQSKHPIVRAIATGQPELVTDPSMSWFDDETDNEHKKLLRQLGLGCFICVPMKSRGRILGAVLFAKTAANSYDMEDLDIAEEVARRGAFSIDNAQLYRQTVKAEKYARESEALKSAILTASLDSIITINGEGRIIEFNPAAVSTFGYTSDDVIGNVMVDLIIPERFRKFHRTMMNDILSTGNNSHLGRRIEVIAMRSDGTEFPAEMVIASLEIQDRPIFTIYLRDITERKRHETEIAKARDVAVESARLKSEFVANVSHEIRTPLNGIVGMAGLLMESNLNHRQKSNCESIRDCCESLLTIINDILDFSKIESGKIELEMQEFDLRSIVESTLELLAPRAHGKNLELVATLAENVPTQLKGDPTRLRQVLTNLFSNAVKFTEKGNVVLSVTNLAETENSVRLLIEVTDNGIGISPDQQKTLFQPFRQADSSMTRRYGGTGLGLAISQRFVELMGGKIQLKSDLGKGSTFYFQLNLEKQKGMKTLLPPEKEIQENRVLIIDENSVNRKSLNSQIASFKMRSDGVESIKEGLSSLRRESSAGDPYRTVLIDGRIGHRDLKKFVQETKRLTGQSAPRVVVMVNVHEDIDPVEMNRSGYAGCLTKPVKQSNLLDCLMSVSAKNKKSSSSRSQKKSRNQRWKHRILVAEDNSVNQKVMSMLLHDLGYDADVVANGVEAIDALKHVPYSLVLMDCQMPEMDGFAATAEIRKHENGKSHTPIVALTANAMKGDRERCLAAGMDDYLPKPVHGKDLEVVLSKWMREDEPMKDTKIRLPNGLKDPKLLETLSGLFLKTTPAYIEAIKNALATGDRDSLKTAAHTLRGASGNLGLHSIKELCEAIEINYQLNPLSVLQEKFNQLEKVYEHVKNQLEDKGVNYENSRRRR